MKLPTKEELCKSWVESPGESTGEWALRRIQEAVHLAEEEARREAQPVVDAARAWRKRTAHKPESRNVECSECDLIRAIDAAPATAEAGKAARLGSDPVHVGDVLIPIKPPAPPPSKAVTEERVRILAQIEADKRLDPERKLIAKLIDASEELNARVNDLESAAKTGVCFDPNRPPICAYHPASARSAAGGKTGEDEKVKRVLDAARAIIKSRTEDSTPYYMEKRAWMLNALHDAVIALDEAPAAREGSGA